MEKISVVNIEATRPDSGTDVQPAMCGGWRTHGSRLAAHYSRPLCSHVFRAANGWVIPSLLS